MAARDCSREALVGETPVLSISAAERAGSLGSLALTGVAGSSLAVAAAGDTGAGSGADSDGPLPLPFAVAAVGLDVAGAKIA